MVFIVIEHFLFKTKLFDPLEFQMNEVHGTFNLYYVERTQFHAFCLDVDSVMMKWSSLRDYFKKSVDRRNKAARSGAGGGKQPKKYKYHDQLEWLLAVNRKRP